MFYLQMNKEYHGNIFFFNDTATTEIYTLSLHDALPIWHRGSPDGIRVGNANSAIHSKRPRSEEHTSELQSHSDLVCRLLLEKKNQHHGDGSGAETGLSCDRRRARPSRLEGYHRTPAGDGSHRHGRSFFFNDTATTEIYTLSLHDALPI